MTLEVVAVPLRLTEPGGGKEATVRAQLSDEVASYLREAIMAGELAPGDPVRAEAVGEALEVSATPVREALQALRVEGFLALVPRKGFTVAPLTPDDIRDIFEVHALVAGELTARAAAKATPADLERFQRLHSELTTLAEAGDAALLEAKNHQFHREVYRLAGSKRLKWALGSYVRYVPRAFYAEIVGWPEVAVHDHAAVLNALLSGDSEAARHAMAQHIRNSGEKLAAHFAAMRSV